MQNKTLALALLGVLVPGVARSYDLLDPARRWFPADLTRIVTVDDRGMPSITDTDMGVAAAIGAVEAWNGGGVTVTDGRSGTVAYSLGDGRSDLIFDDPLHICTGTCLAATTTGYYTTSEKACCDGLEVVRITDSDVAFNRSYAWTSTSEPDGCSGEFYVEAVTTHEVGHLIGLGHSAVSSALMYPSISSCNNKPLASDDTSGRDALYDCTSFDLGSCSTGCKSGGESCTTNAECCSNSCKGKPGRKTCR